MSGITPFCSGPCLAHSASWPPLWYFVVTFLFLLHSQSTFSARGLKRLGFDETIVTCSRAKLSFQLGIQMWDVSLQCCVSDNNSSTADQIPGSRLPLWKKRAVLSPAPFPPGQVADDNSDYTPHSQTPHGVCRALSQRSCWHSHNGGGQVS